MADDPPLVVPAPPVFARLDADPVSLVKGSRVSLVKSGAAPPSTVVIGLGWDASTGLRRVPAGSWEMRAIGEFHDARTVKKLADPAARWARTS